ncbi:uncharacterized protein PGTG_21704 [Puccinia graminis f. sp. tritici CRL 75-36-700-3]|uniref:Uncharacterized protein n=1 Tax=Puccinia graminis f. sp. tritici (strain CRL 75-36-700-3 / race SCCL) TaxID=418459 RepID=H6QS60_PUCGT|nr:uncharacterized protein PGTG_21704 [Puccinia graminis f. sp. tritici CRL 75-36-700-3]EHS63530.1 hypothetical protein PGTG_21704 [Puccinia graminis f. sp. tritici CRL 75-36-700-3]
MTVGEGGREDWTLPPATPESGSHGSGGKWQFKVWTPSKAGPRWVAKLPLVQACYFEIAIPLACVYVAAVRKTAA